MKNYLILFDSIKIEKSTVEDFSDEIEVFFTSENSYLDLDLEEGIEYFYRFYTIFEELVSEPSDIFTISFGVLKTKDNKSLIPDHYSLYQNYPNPFNPSTNISYDLPENIMVSINIFDLMGRKVRTLVNSKQAIGSKNIQWNATNENGQPVPAGMYIYTIQAGEFRQTRKMVLLK